MRRRLRKLKGKATIYLEDIDYFAIAPVKIGGSWVWLKWVHELRESRNGVDFITISKQVVHDAI